VRGRSLYVVNVVSIFDEGNTRGAEKSEERGFIHHLIKIITLVLHAKSKHGPTTMPYWKRGHAKRVSDASLHRRRKRFSRDLPRRCSWDNIRIGSAVPIRSERMPATRRSLAMHYRPVHRVPPPAAGHGRGCVGQVVCSVSLARWDVAVPANVMTWHNPITTATSSRRLARLAREIRLSHLRLCACSRDVSHASQ
jgi:hypothetical protein